MCNLQNEYHDMDIDILKYISQIVFIEKRTG